MVKKRLGHMTIFPLQLRRVRHLLLLAAILAVAAAAVWYAGDYAKREVVNELKARAQERLLLYESTLRAALDKFRYLPYVLATNAEIQRLVEHGGQADSINIYLEMLNTAAGSAALFIMDGQGDTLASSNWNSGQSFVGHNYSFRPYFKDAMAGGEGGFFAIGVTTGKPGYFMAHPIRKGKEMLGVAVVKVDLSPLQKDWQEGGETVLVTDANGVIFLSSRKAWKYRTLEPLSLKILEFIRAGRQYGGHALTPLPLTATTNAGMRQLDIEGERFLTSSRALRGLGWNMYYLEPVQPVNERFRSVIAIAGVSVLMIILLALLLRERNLRIRVRRQAEEAMRIREVNRQLEIEVEERRRAEQDLRETQEELIQAGKMAALGQMAATVAHELNQPIAAIRMCSASFKLKLERGRYEDIGSNINKISELTERIAAVAGQLKAFARKSPGRREGVDLRQSLHNALGLLQYQIKVDGCRLEMDIPPEPVMVSGDAVQLDQVFVNLLQNSLDAMRDRNSKLIQVKIGMDGAWGEVVLSDSGPGIKEEALGRLFDPFFTTKESGEGLGLGLSITMGIIRELGGDISCRNQPNGGAQFTLRLPLR
jgi:two-component system C4-dicarboxylate transport sensor histidine kinase DctB